MSADTMDTSKGAASAREPRLREHRMPMRWSLYAFRIERRATRVSVGASVRPRRVCVYAPCREASLPGAGAGRDEIAHAVPVRIWDWRLIRRPATEEIADFYEILGSTLATGSGMALALNMAARMSRSAVMRGIIGMLHHQVLHGQDLHIAMRLFPRVFSPMQLAMVEAASATGLDKAGALLVTMSRRLHDEGKIMRKFVAALAYPVSLLALTFAAAVVLEVWALPPMVELFRTLGGRLPPITEAFYRVAQFLRSEMLVLIPGALVALVGVAAYAPHAVRTRAAQAVSVRLPAVGPIVLSLALVRALGTFVLLKQSGARVRDQFTMAAAASGNCIVAGFFEACYERISLGETVEEAFMAERHRLGDDGNRISGKMEVGMAGADIGPLIERIISELTERAELRLAVLPNVIRWPLLAICCAIIGAIALAIVLPYPNLIADVAQQQTQAVGR